MILNSDSFLAEDRNIRTFRMNERTVYTRMKTTRWDVFNFFFFFFRCQLLRFSILARRNFEPAKFVELRTTVCAVAFIKVSLGM